MKVLENVRILDFSRLLPGPLATQLLAGMGARIIRVEHPQRMDMARIQPPFINGVSSLFRLLNEGKEQIELDYTSEQGREQLLKEVLQADVVIEQFRPGRMAAWKLAYEDLKAIKPDLIYISLSGYGQTGPYADLAGHDINYLAYAGILNLNRDENGKPVLPGIQLADIGSGSYQVVMACLSGLLHRATTGQGSYLDASMLDGLIPMLAIPYSQLLGGITPETANFLNGGLVNYNVYQTADKRWMALGALELKFWNTFCRLVDKPQWERQNPMELSIHVFPKGELELLFSQKTQNEWIELASGHDVCLSPVRTLAEVQQDPHLIARKVFEGWMAAPDS